MNGVAALAGRRPGRCRVARSTPSTARCPASWHRSWRWPGRASWPASASWRRRLYAVCCAHRRRLPRAGTVRPGPPGPADGRRRDDALAALGRIPPVEPGVRRIAPAAGVAARRRRRRRRPDDLAAASVEVDRAGARPTRAHCSCRCRSSRPRWRRRQRPRSAADVDRRRRADDRTRRARRSRVGVPEARSPDRRSRRADRAGRPGQRRATAHADMSEPTTDDRRDRRACPSCAAPIAAGDVFCESCGATLDPAAAGGRRRRPGDAAAVRRRPPRPVQRPPCPSCGGDDVRGRVLPDVRAQAADVARPLHRGADDVDRPASATRASSTPATRTPWRWPPSASAPCSWSATA